jgi:hypothetical protein
MLVATNRKHSSDPFVRLPLAIDTALAMRGAAEDRVLRVICQDFYHARVRGERAVPIAFSVFARRCALSASRIVDAIRSLEGQRVVQVIREGKRTAYYAIRPPEFWLARPKRRPSGAADPRRPAQLRARSLLPPVVVGLNTTAAKTTTANGSSPTRRKGTSTTANGSRTTTASGSREEETEHQDQQSGIRRDGGT